MKTGSRVLARTMLVNAVAPEELSSVLDSLLQAGVIVAYEERGEEVVIEGDLRAMELALERQAKELLGNGPPANDNVDFRGAYYAQCRAFVHTELFRKLSPLHRRIWEHHADGWTHQQIAAKTGATLMAVRVAVKGARLAAKLPGTTSTIGHGERAQACGMAGCDKPQRAKGLCMSHYLGERRQEPGRCSRCGEAAQGELAHCAACLEYFRERKRA